MSKAKLLVSACFLLFCISFLHDPTAYSSHWHDNVICLSVCPPTAKFVQKSEQKVPCCEHGFTTFNTTVQLSTPYTDPGPLKSPGPKFPNFFNKFHWPVAVPYVKQPKCIAKRIGSPQMPTRCSNLRSAQTPYPKFSHLDHADQGYSSQWSVAIPKFFPCLNR